MSWISQNKFMAGFSAAMVLGAGALGYFTYAAMDRYSAANDEYEGALGELKRLQNEHPYPEKTNRDKLVEQKAAFQEKISSFQKQLAAAALPVKPLQPTDFQDKLKESVARVIAKASGDAHLKLPDKFYMGFPEYASKPPTNAAAPLLGRELDAFESIINLLLGAKDVELKDLTREELKEEKQHSTPNPTAGGNAYGKLVHHTGFTMKLESSDIAFRSILNGIVGNKEQFYIVRRIKVSNTNPQSPEKKNSLPAGKPAAPAPEPTHRLEYIFGTERVETTWDIELVDFEEPAAPVKHAAPASAKPPTKPAAPVKPEAPAKPVNNVKEGE